MPLTLADRAALASPVPLLTAAEARATGIRVPGPGYHRVRSGSYAPAEAWRTLEPWRRYQVRVHAFALAHPAAVLCLESAAVLHGLPAFGHTRDIHVHDPDRASSTRFGDVVVHTSRDPRALARVGGILSTSLLDTVLDLARVLPAAQALAVIDAAVSPAQGGPLDAGDLERRSAERTSARGRAVLREVWPLVDSRMESPHESVSHAVIVWSGFAPPEPQVTFRYEGFRDRVDFFFPGTRAVGEADGWGKYGLDDPVAARTRLAEEKRREDRLRRHGHRVARWEPSDAWRVRPVCDALHAIGVPREHAPQRPMLATFRATRRSFTATENR